MVRLCCRLNLGSHAHRLIAIVCLFASQLLIAQDNDVDSVGSNDTQGSSVPRSSLPGSANSIFNATLDLNTATGVIKSENDKRNYRYLLLDNQLRVLLISDPDTEKSATALDVNVGANQNPPERPGLAHFLEHMLFLGSEKYPQAGEYQEFIAQHGGSFNAYTAAESTNYYFEIDNDQL
ncbi:MAG: peptidase, partial [Cellvibrio sp.]|nr:peptidase [Cellvibrio sp.]